MTPGMDDGMVEARAGTPFRIGIGGTIETTVGMIAGGTTEEMLARGIGTAVGGATRIVARIVGTAIADGTTGRSRAPIGFAAHDGEDSHRLARPADR